MPALTGAATINTGFWKTLIAGAGKDNPLLVGALKSLQQLTSGGLTELAKNEDLSRFVL